MFLILMVILKFAFADNTKHPPHSTMAASKPNRLFDLGINPKILCVKCYKDHVMNDCLKCKCKCPTGDGQVTFETKTKKIEPVTKCNIPCSCRDASGNLDKSAYYIDDVPGKAAPTNI